MFLSSHHPPLGTTHLTPFEGAGDGWTGNTRIKPLTCVTRSPSMIFLLLPYLCCVKDMFSGLCHIEESERQLSFSGWVFFYKIPRRPKGMFAPPPLTASSVLEIQSQKHMKTFSCRCFLLVECRLLLFRIRVLSGRRGRG